MRFLLGLIIGATVTVLLAPRLVALGIHLPAAEEPRSRPVDEVVDEVLQAVTQAVGDAAQSQSPSQSQSAEPDPTARESLPLPTLAGTPAHQNTAVEVAEVAKLTPPMLTELSQEQTVWVPFRSEASARGFAGKLTEQLERPFQVLRAGPGQYLVVFGYHTEPERNAVLDQIRTLTGYAQL